MSSPESLIIVLGGIGLLTALWSAWCSVRWFVHKADAVERAMNSIVLASELIVQEFGVNGGRLTPLLPGEQRHKVSTLKEMQADIRKLLVDQKEVLAANDRKAVERGKEIIAELRKSNAPAAS